MYQVDSVYLDLYFYYLHLLYSYNSFLPCLFYFVFISHSCFKKINNQVSSGNGFNFTKLHPVASSIKQTNAVSVTVWSPALTYVEVGTDVATSPFLNGTLVHFQTNEDGESIA